MPSWGSVTLLEAIWTLAFAVAAWRSLAAHAAFSAVRRLPPVPGVPEGAQHAIASYFVLLTRLLFVKSVAGALLGVYAALLPAPPAPPPAWLAGVGNAPGPVLLCVMAGAMVWTALATFRVYRSIAYAVDGGSVPDDLALVERRPDLGRRAYDCPPNHAEEAP